MHSALQHRADKTCIAKISQPKHLSRSRSRTPHALLHMRKKISAHASRTGWGAEGVHDFHIRRWNIPVPNAFRGLDLQTLDSMIHSMHVI